MNYGPIDLWISESLSTNPEFIWLDEPARRRVKVKRLFVRVLLQELKSQQFKAKLTKIFPKEPDKWRQLFNLRPGWAASSFSNHYKLALLRFRKNIYVFRAFAFDMHATAQELNEMMNPKLKQVIKEARERVIQPLSVREQEDLLGRVISDLRPRIYLFSRKKLTFIVNSHHMSHDDMVNELLIKVVENARWYYPFKSYQHIIHSCYQAATRIGINTIKWYNAKKRARLVSDGDTGFFNREIAEGAEFLTNERALADQHEEQMHQSLLYQDLLRKFKPGLEQNIVRLFIGLPDEPLVNQYLDWTAQYKEQTVDSVHDLRQAEVHREYLTEFLQADPFQVGHVHALLERFAHQMRDM